MESAVMNNYYVQYPYTVKYEEAPSKMVEEFFSFSYLYYNYEDIKGWPDVMKERELWSHLKEIRNIKEIKFLEPKIEIKEIEIPAQKPLAWHPV